LHYNNTDFSDRNNSFIHDSLKLHPLIKIFLLKIIEHFRCYGSEHKFHIMPGKVLEHVVPLNTPAGSAQEPESEHVKDRGYPNLYRAAPH